MSKNDEATPRTRRAVLASGTSRRDLTKEPWVSPHRGYHRDTALFDPVRQRVLDAAAVMPHGATVAGWAAAYLHGVTHLDGKDGEKELPVLVAVPPKHQPDRPGITSLRTKLEPADLVTRQRVQCTSAARTAYDLLRLAPDLTTAVIAGDCVLHSGITDATSVLEYAAARPGRRGNRQLRKAVPLLDPAAASPPESRLRMLCRFQAGLPALLVNVPVYDDRGDFLGIPDLLEPETGLVIEYDGAHHRDLVQHTADNLREEGFESAGLTVVRITALDLQDEQAVAARLSAAYQRLPLRIASWTVARRQLAA